MIFIDYRPWVIDEKSSHLTYTGRSFEKITVEIYEQYHLQLEEYSTVMMKVHNYKLSPCD